MKTYYAVAELIRLPGMPKTPSGLVRRAKNEEWVQRPRKGRGGGNEYHIDSLPEETRRHLALNRGVVKATYETPAPVKPLVAVESGASVETLAPANEVDGGDSIYMDPAEIRGAPSVPDRDPRGAERDAMALWRYQVIASALKEPKHSPARTRAINELAAQEWVRPDGQRRRMSAKALANWVTKYERGGLAALRHKHRSDHGVRRVGVTQRWDKACPWPADDVRRAEIAEALVRFIRSCWASGGAGWKAVSDMASVALADLSRTAGWEMSSEMAAEVCYVNRRRVEHERQYAVLAIEEKDAKQWFDKYTPRIRRDWSGFEPMDLVIGDVHPIDIGIRRPDGSIAYPRAIAWQDMGTNRVWLSLVLLAKGEGVRRVHVAQSFASMCSRWGMPKRLYLDNGSEYNWSEMLNGFMELSRLSGQLSVHLLEEDHNVAEAVQAIRSVIRAKPYNAPAKPIEGTFSVLEQGPFRMLPGWVGGNRMRKKTANVGQEPEPFGGTWDEFHAAIDTSLAYYHSRKQSGHLDGKSPREALAAWIERGWGKTAVDFDTLALAFAAEDARRVDRGRVTWGRRVYYADRLLHPDVAGRRLVVRVSEMDPERAFIFDGHRMVCVAALDPTFGGLDTAGAKEASRRAGVLRRYVADVRRDCDRLDLQEQMAAVEQSRLPMPEAPEAGRITAAVVSDELEQMVAADPKVAQLEREQAAAKQEDFDERFQAGIARLREQQAKRQRLG